jgi:hypothetical protein
MTGPNLYPTMEEIKQLVASAQTCLTCDASDCGTSANPCYEFTPEGVTVCSQLPWWNGNPVPRETLFEWNARLQQFEFANKGD